MSGFAEGAVVVGKDGSVLRWHLPPGRTASHIPDDRDFAMFLWDRREDILGVAHTHPGSLMPSPSVEDLTTFQAVEAGLGLRFKWWILSGVHETEWSWKGPGPYDYSKDVACLTNFSGINHPPSFIKVYLNNGRNLYPPCVKELRERSRQHRDEVATKTQPGE